MSQHHEVTRWVVNHITQDGSVPPEVVTDLLTMLDEDEAAQSAPAPVPAAPTVPDAVESTDPSASASSEEVPADAPAQ